MQKITLGSLMLATTLIILLMIALVLVYDTYVDSEPIHEAAWFTATSIAATNTAAIRATVDSLTEMTR